MQTGGPQHGQAPILCCSSVVHHPPRQCTQIPIESVVASADLSPGRVYNHPKVRLAASAAKLEKPAVWSVWTLTGMDPSHCRATHSAIETRSSLRDHLSWSFPQARNEGGDFSPSSIAIPSLSPAWRRLGQDKTVDGPRQAPRLLHRDCLHPDQLETCRRLDPSKIGRQFDLVECIP